MSEFRPPKVMIGMPIGSGTLPWGTAKSLLMTQAGCIIAKVPLRIEPVIGCSIVTVARSAVVHAFLKSDCTHLFWIDADMEWTLDDFMKILGKASVLDIVGATYPLKREPIQVHVNRFSDDGDYEVNGLGCVKVKSLGFGFICMRREVIEKVAATKRDMHDAVNGLTMKNVFRIDTGLGDTMRGEDVAFLDDARELGYDVWLDPTLRLGHIGQKTYRGDVVNALGLEELFPQEGTT